MFSFKRKNISNTKLSLLMIIFLDFSNYYNVSAGRNAGSKEASLWNEASLNEDVFDNIVINKASQSLMDQTYEREGEVFIFLFILGCLMMIQSVSITL